MLPRPVLPESTSELEARGDLCSSWLEERTGTAERRAVDRVVDVVAGLPIEHVEHVQRDRESERSLQRHVLGVVHIELRMRAGAA